MSAVSPDHSLQTEPGDILELATREIRSKLEQLETRLAEARDQLGAEKRLNEKLLEKVAAAEVEAEQTRAAQRELRTRLAQADELAQQHEARVDEVTRDFEHRLQEMQRKHDSLAMAREDLQRTTEILSAELDTAQDKVDAITAERDTALRERNDSLQKLEDLVTEKNESAGELQALRDRITEHEKSAAHHEESHAIHAAMAVERDRLAATLEGVQQQLAAQTAAASEAFAAEKSQLEAELAGARDREHALQARAAELEQTLITLTERNEVSHAEHGRLAGELSKARENEAALHFRIAELEQGIARSQQTSAAENARLQAELAEIRDRETALQSRAAELESHLAAAAAARSQADTELHHAQAAAGEQRERLEQLAREKSAAEQHAAALAEAVATAQASLEASADTQARVRELEAHLEVAEQTAAAARASWTEISQVNQALAAEIEALKNEHRATLALREPQAAIEAVAAPDPALTERLSAAEARLEKVLAEREAFRTELAQKADLEQQLEVLRLTYAELVERLTESQRTARDLRGELDMRAAATPAPAREPAAAATSGLVFQGSAAESDDQLQIVDLSAEVEPTAALMGTTTTPHPSATISTQAPAKKLPASKLPALPETLKAMRNCLNYFIRHPRDTKILGDLSQHVHALQAKAAFEELPSVARTSSALELLTRDLAATPAKVNPTTLRSISQTLDFLGLLIENRNRLLRQELFGDRVLVIDDDPDILASISGALALVALRPSPAPNAEAALHLLAAKPFDLILLDVGLPGMNGLELCKKIRILPGHGKTPILFLTGEASPQNRVESSLSGGNDFIGKPFNVLELDLKAITWIFKGKLGLL